MWTFSVKLENIPQLLSTSACTLACVKADPVSRKLRRQSLAKWELHHHHWSTRAPYFWMQWNLGSTMRACSSWSLTWSSWMCISNTSSMIRFLLSICRAEVVQLTCLMNNLRSFCSTTASFSFVLTYWELKPEGGIAWVHHIVWYFVSEQLWTHQTGIDGRHCWLLYQKSNKQQPFSCGLHLFYGKVYTCRAAQ